MRAQHDRRLLAIVGEEALSELDRKYLAFAERFEREIVHQGAPGSEDRTIEETLDLGWRTLSMIPASEYRRIAKDLVTRYFTQIMGDGVKTPYY